jgi:hypothetical protein
VSKSQLSYASVKNVWPGISENKFRKRVIIALGVYFDESYNNRLFLIGGLIAFGADIQRLERAWSARIAKENKRLLSQGRKPITRYHAAELNARNEEFEGWTANESKAFSKALLRLVRKREIYAIGYGVILKDLQSVFPEFISTHKKLEEGAYQFATWKCLDFVHDQFAKHIPVSTRQTNGISFIYERGRFADSANAGYRMVRDGPHYEYRDAFNSIAEGNHESHIALQAADLLAYECFRETSRHIYYASKPKRKFFVKMVRNSGVILHIAYASERYLRELKAATMT